MQQQITTDMLADFIITNRKDKVFYGWTRVEIMQFLCECMEDKVLVYSVDSEGRINGVLAAMKFPRVIRICELLATSTKAFRSMTARMREWYPTHGIEGERKGRIIVYDANKLIRKIVNNK